MEKRGLGELEVSTMGLGCMGMSEFYDAADEKQSIQTIHRALDLGINFFDTADMYGVGGYYSSSEQLPPGASEILLIIDES